MTIRYLTTAGRFLHVATRPTPESRRLDYDWEDFASEFESVAAGRDRYLIDDRLNKYLTHYFGPEPRA